jgi:uncharacterized repeat protein (TIGR01451 family)
MKRFTAVVLFAVAASTLALAGSALTAIPAGTASTLASAIAADAGVVTGASFMSVPPSGTPNAIADSGSALAGFPTGGGTYAILTSGNANLADDLNDADNSGANLGGANVRGNTDFDVTTLKIDLDVPAGKNCLTFDFRFLSEEFPEYVGTKYNDAFIAELDASTWSTSGSTITAPSNFAFDATNNVISINAAGAASMSEAQASGTTYDGATPLLSASTPITAGAHSLYLSIFDQGDRIYDSAVFVDGLVLGTTAAGGCKAGATVLAAAVTADSATSVPGGSNGYTVTIKNPSSSAVTLSSIFDVLPAGFSYASGSTTGVSTANPAISGQTLSWAGPFNVPAASNVTLSFDVTVSSTPGEYLNDAGGEAASGAVTPTGPTAKITVAPASHNQPPSCHGVSATPTALWPADGELQLVTLADATDPDGDSVTLSVTTVTQDEPVGHADDASLGLESNQVWLRAWRDEHGDGRVYRIGYVAEDAKGGSCTGTVYVTVPLHHGSDAVDSGDVYYSISFTP